MSEQGPKSIKEVLSSQRFQKEVSLLLFFFAGLSAIFSLLMFAGATAHETVFASALTYTVQAIVYAVLAILIRRGSVKAVVFTGFLFALDTVLTLVGPSWEGARGIIIARGLLIFVLIRYIRRERWASD